MASSKEYLHFILEQLSDLNAVSYRSMMGEFILYYRGKDELPSPKQKRKNNGVQ